MMTDALRYVVYDTPLCLICSLRSSGRFLCQSHDVYWRYSFVEETPLLIC